MTQHTPGPWYITDGRILSNGFVALAATPDVMPTTEWLKEELPPEVIAEIQSWNGGAK